MLSVGKNRDGKEKKSVNVTQSFARKSQKSKLIVISPSLDSFIDLIYQAELIATPVVIATMFFNDIELQLS